MVRPEDVELQSVNTREGTSDYCTSVEEVIGRQTTRALAAGAPVPRDAIRQPLLVRRGEVVTVHARGPGVHVRITARAREDGSLGELVSVESLHDRKTFLARVCDSREVEVFAGAVRVQDSSEPSGTASAMRPIGERAERSLPAGAIAN
jgi:flagella basal body P-ring formation protein FlgA